MSKLFKFDHHVGDYKPATDEEVLEGAEIVKQRKLGIGEVFEGFETAKRLLPKLPWSPDVEDFYIGHVDKLGKLIALVPLMRGDESNVNVPTKDVIQSVIQFNSHKVFVAHNHPHSSTAEPSETDCENTPKIAMALALFDVDLIDSYVVCKEDVGSIKDHIIAKRGREVLSRLNKDGMPPALRAALKQLGESMGGKVGVAVLGPEGVEVIHEPSETESVPDGAVKH